MRTSMRRERKKNKMRDERDENRFCARAAALKYLKTGLPIRKTVRKVVQQTGLTICRGTVGQLSKALSTKNETDLNKLLNPSLHRAGRRHVLSTAEQKMLTSTAIADSVKGKAWTATDMRVAMAKISNDGQKDCFKQGIPVTNTFRKFRADHPEITFRNKVNKELSKQQGEKYDHVKTLQEVLQQILEKDSDIKDDPNRVWNMDETSVDCEFGPKEKVACSSTSNKSGSTISADHSGGGAHVTCVVAVGCTEKLEVG